MQSLWISLGYLFAAGKKMIRPSQFPAPEAQTLLRFRCAYGGLGKEKERAARILPYSYQYLLRV